MRIFELPALYRGHPLLTSEEDLDEAREIRRDLANHSRSLRD